MAGSEPRSTGCGRARPVPAAAPAATVQLVVDAPLHRADIPGLCRRVCRLLAANNAPRIVCDVGAFADADAVVVDALAQLQLAARRLERTVELRRAGPELRALLTLVGLDDVVSFAGDELP